MIPQPRRNHPRLTIRIANLGIHSIIFKDFTHLLNENRQRQKYKRVRKEIVQNKNSTPNGVNNTLNVQEQRTFYNNNNIAFTTTTTKNFLKQRNCPHCPSHMSEQSGNVGKLHKFNFSMNVTLFWFVYPSKFNLPQQSNVIIHVINCKIDFLYQQNTNGTSVMQI